MSRPRGNRRRKVRLALGSLAGLRSKRRRRPPTIGISATTADACTYYLCPDYPVPSGGIRVIYRHVDILNEAGRKAAVLHHRDGFACRWFEHSTPVVGAPSASLSPRDTLVVPEVYGPYFDRLPRQPRLIVFNQNAYLTFDQVSAGSTPAYSIFEAGMTVSEDSAEYLRFAFPGLDVSVVGNAIDPEVFHPSAERPPRRIALMPRKRPHDAERILRLLGDRLRGWEVVTIENADERQAAAMLRSAPIFLALGRSEGFGMPAAEAMASGCYVVGFPAFGGREIFDPSSSTPVEDGDVLSAARALAAAIDLYEARPDELREAGARARERTLERWSMERQRAALLAFHDRLGDG